MIRRLFLAAALAALMTGLLVALLVPNVPNANTVASRVARAYVEGGIDEAAQAVPSGAKAVLIPPSDAPPVDPAPQPEPAPNSSLVVVAIADVGTIVELTRNGPVGVGQDRGVTAYVAVPAQRGSRILPAAVGGLGALLAAALAAAAGLRTRGRNSRVAPGQAPDFAPSGPAPFDDPPGPSHHPHPNPYLAARDSGGPPDPQRDSNRRDASPASTLKDREERDVLVAGFAALAPRLPPGLDAEAADVLRRAGVTIHRAEPGEPFDPEQHTSVGTESAPTAGQAHTVARTERPGFLDHGIPITRPMVVVYTEPTNAGHNSPSDRGALP